eukprot:6014964-Prymnesium_polylepis.1
MLGTGASNLLLSGFEAASARLAPSGLLSCFAGALLGRMPKASKLSQGERATAARGGSAAMAKAAKSLRSRDPTVRTLLPDTQEGAVPHRDRPA